MNLQSNKKLVEEEKEANNSVGSLQDLEGCYHAVYNLSEDFEQKMYTDQTGRFPVQSYRGMQYVMVLYKISSNSILVKPLGNRTSGEMVAAYTNLLDRLKESGIKPTLHILDNEISQEYKDAIGTNNMKFQLVPPNNHRCKIAEKAIQVFKDHFISKL